MDWRGVDVSFYSIGGAYGVYWFGDWVSAIFGMYNVVLDGWAERDGYWVLQFEFSALIT